MGKFMLIGGGDVGRGRTNYETGLIDLEVVKMTQKDNPNFLFIGLASSFSDSYYDTMKKIYQELGCTCSYLKKKNILNNPDIVENKIKMADIIYFCGGDTIKLVNDLKEYGIDSLLKEAIFEGTVIAGMSAGAIMSCYSGYSDALKLRDEGDSFSFVLGLNFLDIVICPHYEKNSEKDLELKEDLVGKNMTVYALENGVALKILGNDYQVITSIAGRKAYRCFYNQNGEYIVEELSDKGTFINE